ncbi:MAG: YlxR family protein [Mycoplasmoidaceae bacterium]|nr:YlxR family protein [Mycoplasmoidaceae bacterium]
MSRKNKGLRTCLYSNKHFDRQELIRLVKVNNKLVIDKKQNMPGRGY